MAKEHVATYLNDRLIQRAEEQRSRVETKRLDTAKTALTLAP
jgi:hypothetical protein